MKYKNIFSAAFLAMAAFVGFNSCDTDPETEVVQDLYKYDSQYFENLRAWKQSPHEVSYAYYASYSNTMTPTSWGERIIGLPDSLDIVNLWGDVPTMESNPIAYEDMVYCQKTKGTRFVLHADAAHYNHYVWARTYNEAKGEFEYEYDAAGNHILIKTDPDSIETIVYYARWAVDTLVQCGIDGVDFDYEGWSGKNITIVAEECDKYIGPNGKWPEKLFIIDWFNSAPPADTEPFTDYYVRQAYSWQIGFQTGSGGRPIERTILCESTGAESADGGVNGAMVREYAAWEPATGHKGGFGAYYIDYNYKSQSGIPYKEYREAIQIQNPAVHK